MLSLVLFGTFALSSTVTGMPPGNEAEERRLRELATCQESWFPARDFTRQLAEYIKLFDSDYTISNEETAFLPNGPVRVLGFSLIKVYPQTLGKDLGFSLHLVGTLAQVRLEAERLLGKQLECSYSEEMTSCVLEVDSTRTVTLVGVGDGMDKLSLLGCTYNFEN